MYNWGDLDGYAVSHNMPDLRELPLDRFANFVWFMFTRNSNDTERRKFESQIWRPMQGEENIDARSPWSPESETNALASLKSGLGLSGKVSSTAEKSAIPST